MTTLLIDLQSKFASLENKFRLVIYRMRFHEQRDIYWIEELLQLRRLQTRIIDYLLSYKEGWKFHVKLVLPCQELSAIFSCWKNISNLQKNFTQNQKMRKSLGHFYMPLSWINALLQLRKKIVFFFKFGERKIMLNLARI